MTNWREMKLYIGFDDALDGALLGALAPHVEARMPEIMEAFYERILANEGTRSVLRTEAETERLKLTQAQWLRELLAGPWDDDYFARRRRVGEVHVRVGLAERYMFMSMNVMRRLVCQVARESLELAEPTCDAVVRITDLDLAAMTSAYLVAQQDRRLADLRDLLIENLPVTVLLLDAEGVVVSATRADTRLFGAREATGLSYRDYLPQELIEAADLPTALGRAVGEGSTVTLSQVDLGTGSEARHFRFTLVPLDHGSVRLLLHLEELTEAVRPRIELERVESLARIGALAANVAHEIRNPLAAISTTLQVIGASLPSDDRRGPVLAKVQQQVVRLDRLVTDLLGFARPPVLRLVTADCRGIAREALAESGVQATLAGPPEGGMLRTDPHLVKQVLVNLLQNARDASGPHGTVELHTAPGVFDVSDDGPGVDPEVVQRLFEPFVTTKAKGTGLGLAISRKLAESLGGELQVVPTRTGATFRLTLPCAGRASPSGSGAGSA